MIKAIAAAAGLAAMLGACGPGDPAAGNAAAGATANAPAPPDPANAAVTAAAAAAELDPVAGRSSRFTKLADANCRLIEEIAETGDWTRSCPGAGGYTLEWSSGDLREDLTLVRGGRRSELGLPVKVANGAFDSIGETVEWRGPDGGAPDVMIARVHVSGPDGKADSGRLAIVRLDDMPCLAAIVPPGPAQSDRARTIADGALPACIAA